MSLTASEHALLPELEEEYEWESELEAEDESEFEGEEFLGAIANIARGLLGEGEDELEVEGEFEQEWEAEYEREGEDELEAMANPQARWYPDAAMAHLGHVAAATESEAEAEAFIGALVPLATSLIGRAAPLIARAAPKLIRGVTTTTRALRRHRASRPLVQALPTVMTRTVRALARRAATGRPITGQVALRTLAGQTASVLRDPRARRHAVRRCRSLDHAYHRHVRSSASPRGTVVPTYRGPSTGGLRGTGRQYRYPQLIGRSMRAGYPPLSVAWVPVPALAGPVRFRRR
jgi:hypothetical protein